MADVKFNAKLYKNRKNEERMQVSGSQADFEKATSDKEALNALVKSIKDAVKAK